MSRRITALGLLTLCALGCAQEHTSSCPDLAAALAADAMIRAHRCARWVACYRDGNTLWGPRCEDAPDADALCAGLSSGAVVFHRERLDACLADLAACEAAPCYEHLPPGSWPPLTSPCRWSTCRSVLEGAPPVPCSDLDPRGNCVASGECGGMLQPLGAEGALCTFDLRCAPGLHCGEGARCTDTCSRDFDCDADPGSGLLGVCVAGHCTTAPPAALGEPCTAGSSLGCAGTDVYCHRVTGRCTAQAELGEACDSTGGVEACAHWYTCGSDGTCVSDPSFCDSVFGCPPETPYCPAEGGPCTADVTMQGCNTVFVWSSGYEWCSEGYACVGSPRLESLDGHCLPVVPVGAACDASVTCATGASCEGGRCLPVVAQGAACDASVACGDLHACLEGRCRLDPGVDRRVGDACEGDAQCASGHCRAGTCVWLSPGEACTLAADECQFGCILAADSRTRVCGTGTPAGIDVACTTSSRCAAGLTCLPRADGTSVCRPLCSP